MKILQMHLVSLCDLTWGEENVEKVFLHKSTYISVFVLLTGLTKKVA